METPRYIPSPDNSADRENGLSVWIGKNIDRDPFDYDNVYFSLLNSLGYPLRFQPFKDKSNHSAVYTNSEETRDKMWSILPKVQETTGYWIMRHISEGESFMIEDLLDNGDKYYYDRTYEGSVITPEGRQTYDAATLQACFLRAQERLPFYIQREKNSAQFERDQKEEALKMEGIEPIDSERLGLQLIKPTIDKILEENPELRPPQRQINPYRR